MVRRRLGRPRAGARPRATPRRTLRELEDVQAIALIAFALLAVAGVFVYVLAGGYLRFLTPGAGKAVSAASVGQASTTPATLPGSVGASSSSGPSPSVAASAEPPPSATASPTARRDAGEMVAEDFRLTPMGAFRDPAWRTSPPDAGLSIVAVPTSVDRSLRAQATPGGGPVVACRAFDASGRRFTVETTLRVDGARTAGPLLSIDTGQAAVLLGRDDGGRLTLADGPTTSATALRIQPGEWYRFVVGVDPDRGTYDIEAQSVARDASRVRRVDLTLGRPSPDAVGLCFAAADAAGASITVDEIRIAPR